MRGLALAVGSIIAAMPMVVEEGRWQADSATRPRA